MTKKMNTLLAHAGSHPDKFHGAVNVPVHRMSTVVMETFAQFEKGPENPFIYGRAGTPTSAAFEEAIAAIEGAAGSFAASSGLSAILTALIAFAGAGDHILITDNFYGPARKSVEAILRKFGVDIEYYPPLIGADIARLFRPNTKLVYMEAPGSLTYEVQDIGTINAAAKKAGLKTVIDNSWATPVFFQPIPFGIDVSVMSATKYIGGHSDGILGVVSANAESWPAIKHAGLMLGTCGGSEELYLALRGLRTLGIRLQHHQKSGLEIAKFLAAHPAVKQVCHPALPSCPGHENWKKYYKGASGTFSIVLHETDRDKIAAMLDHMEYFSMGFSWGGFKSLFFPEQPQASRTAEPWNGGGFSLRVHVGLEDVEDLKADLAAGLKRLTG